MPSRGSVKAGHAYILIEAIDKTQAIFKLVGKRLDAISSNFRMMGFQAAALAGAMSIPLASTIRTVRDFSDEILFLQTKLGATDEQMVSLIDHIKELGRTGSFGATEIASAATSLAQAGFNKEEVQSMLQVVTDFARNARMQLGPTADLLSQTLKTFHRGAEVENARKVVDAFFIAEKRGTVSTQDLAASLPYLQATAAEMNGTLEETLALITAFSNLGTKGSVAGTSLNQFLLSMATQVDKLKQVGFEAFDKGNLKPFMENVEGVFKALEKLDDQSRLEFGVKTFNVRGARSLAIRKAIDEVKTTLMEMNEGFGVSRAAAEKLDSKLGGSIRRIIAAFENLKISAEGALDTIFKFIEDKFIPFISAIDRWSTRNKEAWIQFFAGFAAIASFSGAMLALAAIFKTGAVFLRLLYGPIGLTVRTFKLLFSVISSIGVPVFGALVSTISQLIAMLPVFTLTLVNLPIVIAAMAAAIVTLTVIITAFGKQIKETFFIILKDIGKSLATIFRNMFDDAKRAFEGMSTIFNAFWEPIKRKLDSGELEAAWEIAVKAIQAIWNVALVEMQIAFYRMMNEIRASIAKTLFQVDMLFSYSNMAKLEAERTQQERLTKAFDFTEINKLMQQREQLIQEARRTAFEEMARQGLHSPGTPPLVKPGAPGERMKHEGISLAGGTSVIPAALERGSLEAARKAYENQISQTSLLSSIDSGIKTVVQVLSQGGAGGYQGPRQDMPLVPIGIGRQ